VDPPSGDPEPGGGAGQAESPKRTSERTVERAHEGFEAMLGLLAAGSPHGAPPPMHQSGGACKPMIYLRARRRATGTPVANDSNARQPSIASRPAPLADAAGDVPGGVPRGC